MAILKSRFWWKCLDFSSENKSLLSHFQGLRAGITSKLTERRRSDFSWLFQPMAYSFESIISVQGILTNYHQQSMPPKKILGESLQTNISITIHHANSNPTRPHFSERLGHFQPWWNFTWWNLHQLPLRCLHEFTPEDWVHTLIYDVKKQDRTLSPGDHMNHTCTYYKS